MPNQNKGRSEFFGGRSNPVGDFSRREPAAVGEFFGVQPERAFVLTAVQPDELLASGLAGIDLKQPLRQGRKIEADLLARLAQGAGVVCLAGIDMTRDGGVPRVGKAVLFYRSLLQEQLTFGVEDQ